MRGWGTEACIAARASWRGGACACIVTYYFVHVSVFIQVLYVEHALPQGPVNTVHTYSCEVAFIMYVVKIPCRSCKVNHLGIYNNLINYNHTKH